VKVIHALHRAGDAIRNGGIVCVFAAGQITRTGELNKFQRGFERIMKNVDSPVVPVALGGVWGSLFSFEGGKFFLEMAAPCFVSGDGEFWQTDAGRGAPGGGRIARAVGG